MRGGFNLRKSIVYSVILNVVQLAAIAALIVYIALRGDQVGGRLTMLVVAIAGVVCIADAAADISQVFTARKLWEQQQMLEEANEQMERLNRTLRAQRHDFMNHLQVVNGLIEMGEEREAAAYIERVYGDIQKVSAVLRTDNPSVNALLQVKAGECERRGILMKLDIRSRWDALPMPGWEMCRVLGNLIDNGIDALSHTAEPVLTVRLGEDLHVCSFSVENNGPQIPAGERARIFEAGVSSKGEGRGMGLFIVRSLLAQYGGELDCASAPGKTAFSGTLPKKTGGPEENPGEEKAHGGGARPGSD